ncbi:hypothetical protein BU56_30810 [Escherichia coli O145:H25 str. 07-3858]|nr:hypothetical protein BU56_30810 [Escherichia coli O145:H25 str. 07-3858]
MRSGPGGGCADNAKTKICAGAHVREKQNSVSHCRWLFGEETARVKGSQLAKDPEVLAFIARKQCETVEVDEVPVYRQKKSEQEDKPVAVRRLQYHSRTKTIRRCHRPR